MKNTILKDQAQLIGKAYELLNKKQFERFIKNISNVERDIIISDSPDPQTAFFDQIYVISPYVKYKVRGKFVCLPSKVRIKDLDKLLIGGRKENEIWVRTNLNNNDAYAYLLINKEDGKYVRGFEERVIQNRK